MAKTTEAQARSVAERLIEYLKLEDRHGELDRNRRASGKAMRAAALRSSPESWLRALHHEITEDPGGSVLPSLIARLQRDIIASPRYLAFAPAGKLGGLFRLEGLAGLEERARDDMARFRTHTHEVYTLAVVLATEDPRQAGAFGACDDPETAMREMADLSSKMDALKADLRSRFGGEDIAYGGRGAGGWAADGRGDLARHQRRGGVRGAGGVAD